MVRKRRGFRCLLLLLILAVPLVMYMELPALLKSTAASLRRMRQELKTVGTPVFQSEAPKIILRKIVTDDAERRAWGRNNITVVQQRRASSSRHWELQTSKRKISIPSVPKARWQPPYDKSRYRFTINPQLCSGKAGRSFLVLVQSASRNTERRNAIRDTWASPTKDSFSGIRLGFVLGTPRKASLNDKVLREADEYRDIIMSNFTESYYNLSLSTVTLLRWAVENCAGYDYLVKADDDAFLNLTALRKYLSDKPKKNSIFGYLMRGYRPNRQRESKWYTPQDLYNKSRLPDFVSGFAYVITADAVPELYAAAKVIPLFPLEDVYVTGMCRERTRTVLRNAARFHNHKKKKATSICSYANVLAQHEMTPAEMHTLWQKISSHGCD
ncbi:beta-1,3-galactosyltransferase 1 [Ixodes scapularis]|uniref:beta-1,3-galactosyltransferase 1 n=1 Tax=Ixodes scapularis TaxID=6945 RepID=UPI001C37F8F9|nr:beta-1,3-galactosyltransferase 1 [Ixodes scapularis]